MVLAHVRPKPAKQFPAFFNMASSLDFDYDDTANSLSVVQTVDWRRYSKPEETADIDECRRVDKYNSETYDYNNSRLNAVNELLLKIGMPCTNVRPPQSYTIAAIRKQELKLFDPHTRLLSAIKYLAENNKYPLRDYELENAAAEADKLSFGMVVNQFIQRGGIDITTAVGEAHLNECNCKNHWDGLSDKCDGKRARLRWRTGTKNMRHHFLRPVVVPESY